MKTILHQASSRGEVSFGWLKSKHSFSFGQYYNPKRMNFGLLRVLNDDIVDGGAGFPTHPHNNMEIVSIPLSGALAHSDSTGTEKAIETGEVQIMSAGSGLTHSEYNHSETEKVNFLQIWVIPKERNITPRYDQMHFNPEDRINKVQTVVAPDNSNALWINQDAWFSLVDLNQGADLKYDIHKEENGIYLFVIEGEIELDKEKLSSRDAVGITETNDIEVRAASDTKLLLIEIPMN